MDESVKIYESILNNQPRAARDGLDEWVREHGLGQVPALSAEHSLALLDTLGRSGLGHFIPHVIRDMACRPDACFWHLLLYYSGLRGSLGFLVTLELMEQLESEILGTPRHHAPLRDLVINPSASGSDSLISKRERHVLSELAGRTIEPDPAQVPLYQFAFRCMRAHLHASGYWQRTAREHLEQGSRELESLWPELEQQPLVASYLIRQLLSGNAHLRYWETCEELLERLRGLPGTQEDYDGWKVFLAECRGDTEEAHRLLLDGETTGEDSIRYWHHRAATDIKREEFADARRSFERSMAIAGRKPHGYYGSLGMCHYREGDREEAIRLWRGSGSKAWCKLADLLQERLESDTVCDRVSLDVPTILQKPNHCGPCSLSMIARFWGVELTQEEISEALSPWGTHLFQLATFAEDHGLAAVFGARDFDAVAAAVTAGFPVLLGFSYPGGGHFVLAIGHDPNLDLLEIRDPGSTFVHLLGRERYEKEAGYMDYLTAVICPPDKVPSVPSLAHGESLYRDLAKAQIDRHTSQAICEGLRSKYADDVLDEFSSYADLRLHRLLDDSQFQSARELAAEILDKNEDNLYACSRVAEAFLRADCIQDAYETVCRVDPDANGHEEAKGGTLNDLLQEGRSPSHEYVEFIRARCAQQLGNLQVAAVSLTRSINRYPVHGGKFLALADLMERLGEEEEQLKFLDVAQQISGPNATAATAELAILRRKEDYPAAMELIDKTLKEFDDQAWLWLSKGELCEEMHDYGEAEACYRRVAEELPEWHPSYTHLLGLFDRNQNVQAAETLLGELDAKMGDCADRWCVRAYWASLKRDWPRVVELAERCLAEAPGHSWAYYFKGRALESMGRLEDAVGVWQQVVEEVDPSDYYWDAAVAWLGRLGRKLEDVTAFESAFERAIEVAPDSPSLWSAMCDCFRFRGSPQDAVEYFEALYGRVTDKAGLAMTVGDLLMELHSMPEARSWFERIPAQNVAFPEAVGGIVRSLSEENRLEDAMGMLQQMAEQTPSCEIYSMLVNVHLDSYQANEAIQWLRRSLAEFPDRLPDGTYRLLRALDAMGAGEEIASLIEFIGQRKEQLVGRPRAQMSLCIAEAHKYLGHIELALRACDEVLEVDASSGPAWITKAEILFDDGKFDEGLTCARRACDTRYDPYPFRQYFSFLRDMGRIDEAFEVCIEGLEIFPGQLGFQEMLDQLVLQFQMLDRYLEACERLFPLVEDKASFLGNQGTVFWRLGDNEHARQFYEQALTHGDRSWLHAQLGVVLREEGDFPEAERELQTALRLDPNYDYAAERLAALYVDWFFSYEQLAEHLDGVADLPTQEALLEKIHRFYEHMAATQPNNEDFFRDYCDFGVRCGDLTAAETLGARYRETSAVYSAICCHLAQAHTNLHDVEAAYGYLQQAVNCDEPEPFKAQVYLRMGWHIARFQHDPNRALDWYRRAVAADPENIDGYQAVAGVLEDQGRLDETFGEVLAGLGQVEDPTPLLRPLASTAVQAGRWREVHEAIQECLHRFPARAAAAGWLQVARGLAEGYDYEGAYSVLELAEATCPLPVELEAARLMIALQQSEYERAEGTTQRLLELDPDNLRGLHESSRLALRRGDPRLALEFLERFVQAGGNPPGYLTDYAYAAFDRDCMPALLEFCDSCYTEGHVRGKIHLLAMTAYHLLGDQAMVERLLESLPDVDASEVADAEIILADVMVNQGRYEEALPRLSRAIASDPQNTFARCLYVGTVYALGNVEAALPHIAAILQDPATDHWELMALCRTPILMYPDQKAEAARYRSFFEPFRIAAETMPDRRTVRRTLLDITNRWELYDVAVEYAKEALDNDPFLDELSDMFEVAVCHKDLALADRVVEAGQALHLHPVSTAQMKSICHASRGEVEQAIAAAYDSRHGHGSLFAEMCTQLFEAGADVGDLCDTLFDCMVRYHEGHGPCSAWALLLLFRHGRTAQFEQGLASMVAAAGDYRLSVEQRQASAAACAAVKLYCVQQTGDAEAESEIRQVIAKMPYFGSGVGSDLYELLGFAGGEG